MPSSAWKWRSRKHAARKDQHVLGTQWIGALRYLGQQVVRDDRPPPEMSPPELVTQRLNAGCAGTQVNVQDAVPVAVRHDSVVLFSSGQCAARLTGRGQAEA